MLDAAVAFRIPRHLHGTRKACTASHELPRGHESACALRHGTSHHSSTFLTCQILTSLSAPAVAKQLGPQKSTEYTGSFSCHTICSVLAFILAA